MDASAVTGGKTSTDCETSNGSGRKEGGRGGASINEMLRGVLRRVELITHCHRASDRNIS